VVKSIFQINVNSIIDEVLCFLFNNFSKVTVSELKVVTVSSMTTKNLLSRKRFCWKWCRMRYMTIVMIAVFRECRKSRNGSKDVVN